MRTNGNGIKTIVNTVISKRYIIISIVSHCAGFLALTKTRLLLKAYIMNAENLSMFSILFRFIILMHEHCSKNCKNKI